MSLSRDGAEIVKGLLDALVLHVLQDQDNYGFGIVQVLNRRLGEENAVLQESTIYPLLHRLQQKGFLSSYRRPGNRGTARKYYRINKRGRLYLTARLTDWEKVAKILRKVLLRA